MSRRPRLLLGLLAVLLVVAGVNTLRSAPGAPAEEESECTSSFPKRIATIAPVRGGALTGALLLCSDVPGQATLVVNGTRAVWTAEVPPFAATYRYPLSVPDQSFLGLVDQREPLVPAGSALVVLAPPGDVDMTVEPAATVAQLVHDQLIATLAKDSDSLRELSYVEGSTARAALASCLLAILDRIDSADDVLRTGSPADRIHRAAERVPADSGCAQTWNNAKVDAGAPSGLVTPFGSDVERWGSDEIFVLRGRSAADTWRLEHPRLDVPMREARGAAPVATPWG